jgi:putative transposase
VAETMSREERINLIEMENKELSVSIQAGLLGLNRSGLYYRPIPVSQEELSLKHKIDEIYTSHPYYGSRRITAVLNNEGYEVNRKAVQRHMREMGIEGIHPGPNLSKRALKEHIFPYLLRGLSIEYPNQVWGIDITYIRMKEAWMYLVAVIDWFSRYVVNWELDQTLEIAFVLKTVSRSFTTARPEIFNSDQGSHFTSSKYIELLKQANVNISMDGKGRAIDNIFTERFWRSLKYEEVYLNEYKTCRQARTGISRYMDFYNNERPHQSLDYKTPRQLYYA